MANISKKFKSIVDDSLSKLSGGSDYFNTIDQKLKLPKNKDIIKSVFATINKEQKGEFNLILTGGFGDWIKDLIKKGDLKVPGNLILTNGSLRKGNDNLHTKSKGKEVDIIHRKHDLSNQKFVLFDDSYYSGSTKKAIEEYLKKHNSYIYKTYVVYDGSDKNELDRTSLYRYYDHHNGTQLPIDKLLQYLHSLKTDFPKGIVKDKILNKELKTLNDINNYIGYMSKDGIPKLTHSEETSIIKTFESFKLNSYEFIINYTMLLKNL